MARRRQTRSPPPAPSTELERRAAAFKSEYFADKAWDSEFTPSPHSPYAAMGALAALGADALPALVEYAGSGDRELRRLSCYGLQLLGPAAGPAAVTVLEALLKEAWCRDPAAQALYAIAPEHFWASGLQRCTGAIGSLMREALKQPEGGASLLARLVELDEEAPLLAALESLDGFVTHTGEGQPLPGPLLVALRRCALSRHASVRGRATYTLTKLPRASPVEALIEGMITSGHLGGLAQVAWHEGSLPLIHTAAARRELNHLAELLARRRCAGLSTDGEPLLALVEEALRNPKREWRYEEHEVEAAARCAFELGHPALLAPLVDAVLPENSGSAWNALTEALRSFGPPAREALQARQAQVSGEVLERTGWMLQAVARPLDAARLLEVGDHAFVRGSIDHTTGGAFWSYAKALRAAPSAHAAFQLAWIDRAFGAELSPARVEWIRRLGFLDEALLEALSRAVEPLTGSRSSWRTCNPPDAARALAAGLPGLAYTGSRDPAHQAQATAHVARVKAASARR